MKSNDALSGRLPIIQQYTRRPLPSVRSNAYLDFTVGSQLLQDHKIGIGDEVEPESQI